MFTQCPPYATMLWFFLLRHWPIKYEKSPTSKWSGTPVKPTLCSILANKRTLCPKASYNAGKGRGSNVLNPIKTLYDRIRIEGVTGIPEGWQSSIIKNHAITFFGKTSTHIDGDSRQTLPSSSSSARGRYFSLWKSTTWWRAQDISIRKPLLDFKLSNGKAR